VQNCPFVEFEVVTVVNSEERHQMVWNEFLSSGRTLRSEERDYKEWHKGRREYAAWMIDIQSEPVRSRFDAAREHLAEFLLEPYRRQAHVTLFVCGFLVEVPRFDDDYAIEERKYHLRALREAEIAPFEIKVGGINSFAATPFLEVFDVGGGIKRVREVLSSTRCEIRAGEYVPHLTLGLYSGEFEVAGVAERISSFGAVSPITYLVDEISLTTYSAFEIAGPLAAAYGVDLGAR
jgi:2'-5' RNA ligase